MPKPQSNAFTVDANASHDANGRVQQNLKFAAITAAVSDILLDDETSPSNSLLSSTASDDVAPEKAKKRVTELKKCIDDDEKDIDEISPIFDVASPASQGTPTHATNSFSFSDGEGGRDFLIDDEIADQPVLCFSDKNHGKYHWTQGEYPSFIDDTIQHLQPQTRNCTQSPIQQLSPKALRRQNRRHM